MNNPVNVSNKNLTLYTSIVEWFEFCNEVFLKDPSVSKKQLVELLDHATQYINYLSSPEPKDADKLKTLNNILTTLNNLRTRLKDNLNESKPSSNNKESKSRSNKISQMFLKDVEETKVTPRVGGFKQIAGYCDIKKQLKTLVVLPKKQPQLYVGHKVFRSMLLYGPPGTGKTQLAHALASEADADIYCVTASTIMSAYVGETEKMIETLFTFMRNTTKTSILFIDEIDGLCRKRHNNEHDHNRRLKTELMCQLSNFEENENAFLVCATNCPWDLDTAFLRRFGRRIYVPMPNRMDRFELLKLYTMDTLLYNTHPSWDVLLDITEGYSGSDLKELVRNALLKPMSELEDIQIWKLVDGKFYTPLNNIEILEFSEDFRLCTIDDLPERSVRARELTFSDLLEATKSVPNTIPASEIERFNEYVLNNK